MIPRSMRLDLMRAVSRAGLVGRPRAKPTLETGQPLSGITPRQFPV